jgi:hypothetical protein
VQLTVRVTSRPSLAGTVLLAIAGVLIILAFLQVFYVDVTGDADLVWSANEAYLFVHGGRRGYHFSCLGYAAEAANEYFGIVPTPNDVHEFTSIIRIAPAGPEHYEENGIFEYFTPRGDGLYSAHDGELWKWVGTHFEKASTKNQQELGGVGGLTRKNFDHVNGWSGLYSIESAKKDEFLIQIASLHVIVRVKDGKVSVNILQSGNTSETQSITVRLSCVHGEPERVSRAEYGRLFPWP